MKIEKVIALDLGEVCVDLSPNESFQYFNLPFRDISYFPEKILNAFELFETGKIPDNEFWGIIQESIAPGMSFEQIQTGWNKIIANEKKGTAQLVQTAFDLNYKIVLLTDTSKIHLIKAISILSFSHLLHDFVSSFEVGFRKPHQEMFIEFERRHGIPTIYFDDKIENIEAAKQRQWFTHLFTDPKIALDTFIKRHHALYTTSHSL